MLSAQDTLSTQNIRSKCSSQVWKDLQRDIIVVNGEQISGELGAESMLGALVRHLHDKAEALRVLQSKQPGSEQGVGRGKYLGDRATPSQKKSNQNHHPFSNNTSNNNSTGSNNNNSQGSSSSKSLTSVEFAISEAQIVECAKDLLVLCNRTQSGGDTYFCIEAFLSGDHMKEFCILTPYSAEAEPLEFCIDVVEVSQHLSAAVRQRYNKHLNPVNTEHHTNLLQVPPSMSRSGYEGSISSNNLHQPLSAASNESQLGDAGSELRGSIGVENSFLEEEESNVAAAAANATDRFLSPQLQLRHKNNANQMNLLQHHMHTPPSTTGALRPDFVTPIPSNSYNMRDVIDVAAPSASDFHGLSPSIPSPIRSPDPQIAEARQIRKKSFTFEDVVLETDRRKQPSQGKRLLKGDDDDEDGVDDGNDEDEDETRVYLAAARSSHNKRTGLRLSGSGPAGFLVSKSDEAMVNNNPPSPLVPSRDPSCVHHDAASASSSAAVGSVSSSSSYNHQNSESLSRSTGGPPPPPRRAQLDLKRELQQEGYLNSVWNSDGTSVKLHSSLLSQQQQSGHPRHEQPLPPVPASKPISPHSTSRPSSFPKQGGVAMAYLDISEGVSAPSHTVEVETEPTMPLFLPVSTVVSESNGHAHHSNATVVSDTSSAATQVHLSRPDDVSVISEFTLDTLLRTQKHNRELGHDESHHAIPLHPHHHPGHELHPPPHPPLQHQHQLQLLQHPHHQPNRPTSSGQTTTSGQISPGSISQRTSGQHDALTTTTTSSTPTFSLATSSQDQVSAAATALLTASSQQQQIQSEHDKDSSIKHHLPNQTNGVVVSDGEEYGILDDDGHDSTHSNPQLSSHGPASGSKKKSLLNRIGKKLRPFKMPPLSSSNTDNHTTNITALDAMRSPFNGNNASARSRSHSEAVTPVGPTTTTHFQQFLQHLTPRQQHHHHHHPNATGNNSHNPYHHHDSDRESLTGMHHNHHKSHRHHHHVNLNGNNGGIHSANSSGQNPHFLQQAFQHQPPSLLSSIDSSSGQDASMPPVRYGLRIQVRARCRYRVCGANPTGFVDVDSWATVMGVFEQSFLLVGDGRSQLGITDRLVTIEIDGCTSPRNSLSLSASLDQSGTVYLAPDSHNGQASALPTPSHSEM
jgi:hypothetical protein